MKTLVSLIFLITFGIGPIVGMGACLYQFGFNHGVDAGIHAYRWELDRACKRWNELKNEQ